MLKIHQEMGSDHLPIVAEFIFSEQTRDASEQEDESDQDESEPDNEPAREASTSKHIYFSSDSDSSADAS